MAVPISNSMKPSTKCIDKNAIQTNLENQVSDYIHGCKVSRCKRKLLSGKLKKSLNQSV